MGFEQTNYRADFRTKARWSFVFVLLSVLAIGLIGAFTFGLLKAQSRRSVQEQLSMVADLRVNQVTAWLNSQKTSARGISHGTAMSLVVEKWIASGIIRDEDLSRIRQRITTFALTNHYVEVTVFTLDGRELLSSRSRSSAPAPTRRATRSDLRETMEPRFLRFHVDAGTVEPQLLLELEAPVVAVDRSGSRVVAVLSLQIDPRAELFPILESWPPSHSSDTLLVEGGRNEVRILNQRVRRAGPFVPMTLSVSERESLAVQAGSGHLGQLEGVACGGAPAFGVVRAIAGTDWFLVVEQSKQTFQKSLWLRTLAMSSLILSFVVLAFLTVVSWVRQRSAALVLAGEARYKELFDSMSDAVFIVGNEGKFVDVNVLGCKRLGLRRQEVLELSPSDIENRIDNGSFSDISRRLDEQDHVEYESEHRVAGGGALPVEVRLRRIWLRGKRVELYLARDITDRKAAEEALKLNMVRQQTILSSLHTGVLVESATGIVESLNDYWPRLFDCSRTAESLLGLTSEQFVEHWATHLRAPGEESRRIAAIIARGTPVHDEEFDLGNGRTALRDFIPIYLDGTYAGRVWTLRDITVIKNAEARQHAEEQRLRALMRLNESIALDETALNDIGIDEVLHLTRSNWGSLHFATDDRHSLELSSFRSADKITDGTVEFEIPQQWTGQVAERCRREQSVVFEEYVRRGSDECVERRYERVARWLGVPVIDEQTVVAVFVVARAQSYDENDARQVTLFLNGFWNLLRRKRAERRSVENERFLKTITDALPGVIGYWTRELVCTFANPGYLEWFGRTPEQMLGVHLQAFMSDELYRLNEPYLERVFRGEAQRFERKLDRPDATVGYAWVHYIPDVVDDYVRGFFVLVSDITELKLAQLQLESLNMVLEERTRQAEAANDAKSQFLANMSHEIRTPMNAILGLGHLVLGTELSLKQCDYLTKILSSSQHLLGIINDILDVSKIEAGKLSVEHTEFDLLELVEQVVALSQERAIAKSLSVHVDIAANAPKTLVGDTLRLRQILINLTYNAVKFTDQGSVTLRVSEREALPNTRVLRFVVEDTGVGISRESLTRLFQPFYQVDSSSTRRFSGTGLGLTITKQLVCLMGGEISVESELGQGSRFTVDIPFGTVEARVIDSQTALSEGGVCHGDDELECSTLTSMTRVKVQASRLSTNGRILLVEDNETNRLVAGDMLEMDGYEVMYACNGREAVELVLRCAVSIDLILMDVQMPVLDGLGAARLIREKLPLVPIVAMTAHAMPSERKRCTDAGMSDHLSKPFEPEALRQMVERWLRPSNASSLANARER